jgi:hypothetical protein
VIAEDAAAPAAITRRFFGGGASTSRETVRSGPYDSN